MTDTRTATHSRTMKDEAGNEFEMTFSLSPIAGRLEVTKFTLESKGGTAVLTQEMLRSVRLGEAKKTVRVAQGQSEAGQLSPLTLQPWTASDEQLRLIALLYRNAYSLGEPVQAYISERLGRPVSSVNRWIRIARQKGFLGASNSTRGGEV